MKKEQIYLAQGVISAAAAFASDKLGILFPMLMIFSTMMVLDFISGMIASAKEAIEHPDDPDKGWSSKKGLIGLMKKFSYILTVFVAILVDILLINAGKYIGVDVRMKTFFGLLVTVWFILNEALSILENAGRIGAKIPGFLLKLIATLKKKVEKNGDEKVDDYDKQ